MYVGGIITIAIILEKLENKIHTTISNENREDMLCVVK